MLFNKTEKPFKVEAIEEAVVDTSYRPEVAADFSNEVCNEQHFTQNRWSFSAPNGTSIENLPLPSNAQWIHVLYDGVVYYSNWSSITTHQSGGFVYYKGLYDSSEPHASQSSLTEYLFEICRAPLL